MTGMATLSDTDVKAALVDVPGWELAGADIVKEYKFKDFVAAMAFVNRVADRAEAANHHPDIDIRWNKVTLVLSTHSEGGVTQLDIELAHRIGESTGLSSDPAEEQG
jgi:4a-hydroxytetrahydrobiopterin dehydratase